MCLLALDIYLLPDSVRLEGRMVSLWVSNHSMYTYECVCSGAERSICMSHIFVNTFPQINVLPVSFGEGWTSRNIFPSIAITCNLSNSIFKANLL